ncbi:hypothetical protein [Agromyces humi]|uniref:hypothetical protein n=1 Tax=Agromyces humi TaxID=1766800 RepID=UPI00135884E7|nr:hypothetical protein [Agromyces humi]
MAAAARENAEIRAGFAVEASRLGGLSGYKSLTNTRKTMLQRRIEDLQAAADGNAGQLMTKISRLSIRHAMHESGISFDDATWEFDDLADREIVRENYNLRCLAIYEAGAIRAHFNPEFNNVPKGAGQLAVSVAEQLEAYARADQATPSV